MKKSYGYPDQVFIDDRIRTQFILEGTDPDQLHPDPNPQLHVSSFPKKLMFRNYRIRKHMRRVESKYIIFLREQTDKFDYKKTCHKNVVDILIPNITFTFSGR